MTQTATATADDTSTTTTAPDTTGTTGADDAKGSNGQAADQKGTSTDGKGSGATQTVEDTFFDPKSIEGKPELQAAYKQMQAAFTKKMQHIAKGREKITAYESFEADPIGTMQAMAKRMGYNLTPAQAAAQVAAATGTGEPEEFKSWGEVRDWIKRDLMGEIKQQLAPVFEGVQKVTATNIEKQLNEIDPNWRMYEDEMKSTLQAHPTMVKDVAQLYRLSVPEEVLQSRATQAALKKLEEKGKAAQVHGSTTAPKTQPALKKAASFDEAVEIAREQGKKAGWYK